MILGLDASNPKMTQNGEKTGRGEHSFIASEKMREVPLMLRFLQKLKRKKGFTLVELTCVMAIVAIISSMMLPSVTHYFTDAKIVTANASAAQIRKAIQGFLLDLNLKGLGMKRGKHLNSQIIFVCSNHRWLVKTECKVNPDYRDSKGNKVTDTDGSKTFYDHKNWWYSNVARLMPEDNSIYDANHSLAMCRLVSEMLGDVNSGFVMAFFNDSVCRGVVYIPDYNIVWAETNYTEVAKTDAAVLATFKDKDGNPAGASAQGQRPLLVRGRTDKGYHMKAFGPFCGPWPEVADYRIWKDQAGVDQDGWIVGTAPTIDYSETIVTELKT